MFSVIDQPRKLITPIFIGWDIAHEVKTILEGGFYVDWFNIYIR